MNVDIAEVVQDFSLHGVSQIVSGVLPWAIDPELAEDSSFRSYPTWLADEEGALRDDDP